METSACTAVAVIPKERNQYARWDRTELVQKVGQVAELVSLGMTRQKACELVGIPVLTHIKFTLRDSEAWQIHARSRMEQANSLADEALDVGRSRSVNMTEATDKRTHVDTIKWLCAKLHPRTYGDSRLLELTGANGGPIQVDVQAWTVAGKRVTF